MKKLIFLLVSLIVTLSLSAQLLTVDIVAPATYGAAAVTSATKITNNVAGYILIKAPQHYGSLQDITIKLDSTSGNLTNVAIAVYGQKSAYKADWTQIGSTVNWVGVSKPSVDTTFVFSNASAVYYQNYKVVFTGTGTGVSTIKHLGFKQWLKM